MESESPQDIPNTQNWHIIYPVYIDSSKSTSQGRKLPKSKCVFEPSSICLAEAAKKLSIPTVYEPMKRHPRDPLTFGRLKVQIKKENGGFHLANVTSKRELMVQLASLIPNVSENLDVKLKEMSLASRSALQLVKPVSQESLDPMESTETKKSKKNKKNKKK